ncbi:hypothetical protein ACFLYU_02155 [Candidatus Dependentiae bacterium]
MRKCTIDFLSKFLCRLLCVLCVFASMPSSFMYARTKSVENVLKEKLGDEKGSKRKKRRGSRTVNFSFKDADLVDVINTIAQARGDNIILPSGADAIKSKLTIDIPQKLTVGEAWNVLQTVLDVAGYGIVLNADMYQVEKKGPDLLRSPLRIFKEPSRIFIASPYEQIPNTDERIIYLAYFTNIQVPQKQSEGKNIVQQVLAAYLSPDSAKTGFQFIPSSNGVMIIDKASNIRSIMKIFSELDKAGIKEYMEIIPLKNTSSKEIEKLFTGEQGILGKGKRGRYRLGKKRKSEVKYFEKSTKVVAEPRTNSLILLGSKEAVEKIKDFIYRFVDVSIESGRSVLHRRKLDYLDCNELRKVLLNVIGTEGDEQARSGTSGAGPERFFTGVKIETDRPSEQEGGDKEEGKYKYSGTNSLLVAAKHDDWEKLDELVDKLDKPFKQVIIEVLIVDLRLEGNKALGGQTRNPALAPIFKLGREGRGINGQSAQLTYVLPQDCEECSEASQTIKSDLMQYKVNIGSDDDPVENPLFSSTAGSTLFTISDRDGKTWSVLKLLNLYDHAKVLSHPYIVARNNQPAKVEIGLEKRLQGNSELSASGGARVKIVDVKANIAVDVKPRICGRIGVGEIVNLEIKISINEFENTVDLDPKGSQPRFIREIATNANIKSGEILALGGLIRVENKNELGQTPILGKIPILGYFFKNRSETRKKTNLTVFIKTTIIEPEFRGGFGNFTKDYIQVAKKYSKEGGLFEGLRDPVTRWFFGSGKETDEMIDDFVEQHEKVVSLDEIKLAKAKNNFEQKTVLAHNNLPNNLQNKKDRLDAPGVIPKDINYVPQTQKVASAPAVKKDQVLVVDNNCLSESTLGETSVETPVVAVVDGKRDKENKSGPSDDKLKDLLQGEQNPLVSYFDAIH